MFITHYNNHFMDSDNNRFDYLLYITKNLFRIYEKPILEYEVLEAMYYNDDIYYSSKFLFNSKKSLEYLHKNYCCLAKLIYIYYCDNTYPLELNNIISSMCIKSIPLEELYLNYY